MSLIEYPSGPVLEDYPHNAEDTIVETVPLSCPVNFNTRPEVLPEKEYLLQHLQAEIAAMRDWYDIACKKTCRSTTGVSKLTPEQIYRLYNNFISNDIGETKLSGEKLSDLLRIATQDLKAYYFEAISAQPSQPTTIKTLSDWFWGETYAAAVINEVKKICLNHEAKELILTGKLHLIPRNQMYRFERS